jgi:hypothetical protein
LLRKRFLALGALASIRVRQFEMPEPVDQVAPHLLVPLLRQLDEDDAAVVGCGGALEQAFFLEQGLR